MESVKKSIDKRALHKREYDIRVNERQIQTTEGKVDTGKAVDASLVNKESIVIESKEQDTSRRSGNDAHADDADIRPIYDEEQEWLETTELSNQSLESENIRLKKTVAQFQKDFLRMEAHCVNLELKYQNQALKEGQHGQFLKVTSNEAKVKHDIDVIETINIKLEHKVAKLLKENETLKKHYKELYDSIKTTRAKNIEHTTSLIANNDKFKAQLQEKGFAIAALKNELRKLTGNSVNTKFSKQRFASQVDVNNDLSKPVTTHYLPKERESVVAKPHHMIAPGSSSSELGIHDHSNELSSSKLVPKVVPPADKTATSRQESSIKENNPIKGDCKQAFQDDAKYEHVGQDTRSQGGKDDQRRKDKDLKISDEQDNDKGSRSKITKHEGTILQRRQRQRS
ncbi:hypothetical protein Tco_0333255 [Tanacetum coccineum]